uniref:Uncharacterized protein n=1 Tax=Anguilla anguilla TaxID=7936 RepID=A0A0E9TKT2_ANGAN
MSEFNSKR